VLLSAVRSWSDFYAPEDAFCSRVPLTDLLEQKFHARQISLGFSWFNSLIGRAHSAYFDNAEVLTRILDHGLQEQYPHYWQLLATNPEGSIAGHTCKALEMLDALAEKDRLKEFGEEIKKRAAKVECCDKVGVNCHDVTIALLNDLDKAGTLSGWLKVKVQCGCRFRG
jgi:uncharacterized protein YjhX (UPF0386 family)